jgi:SAM-dependent methyltransferase
LVPIDLSSAGGRSTFEKAIAMAQSVTESDPVRRATKIRTLVEPELATAALAQADLRSRATVKFGAEAARMYFTSDGLEQATRAEIADHRAARYTAAGVGSVLDLCCGIGADIAAFLRAGLTVTGVERDAATAALAQANYPAARITVGAAEDAEWESAEAVFLDPARRTTRGRTFDPASYSPSFDFVGSVLAGSRYAAAKLGPGIDHALIPLGVEAEWVSFEGGVKEAVLWSAGFASVRRRATVLPAGVELTDDDVLADGIGPVGRYLYEPDGAVIRAGLVQQAAALLPGGRRLDEHLAYLSADEAVATPLARGYEVHDVLPYSVKRLRAELAAREVGIVEIKKRGVDIDPAALRRELKPRGANSLTVILARVGERRLAVLARPLVS